MYVSFKDFGFIFNLDEYDVVNTNYLCIKNYFY